MRKKTLFQIIIVLLFVNIATLYLWQKGENALGSDSNTNIDSEEIRTDEVVATVGDQMITYHEWNDQLMEARGKDALTDMINKELVRQAGEEKGITIDEKIINRDIALLATMQHGLTEEEVMREKERWHDQIVYRYTLEALLTEGLSINEDELQAYYHTYQNQYNFSESLQMSHIVVSTMSEAEQVKSELDEGAPFALLAQEYSIDDASKNNGGYIGHMSITSQFLPAGYYEQAVELEPFSYSDPFQTDQGAVILYLHEHYPAYEFTYDELRPYIERELLLQKSEEHMDVTDLWDLYHVEWFYD